MPREISKTKIRERQMPPSKCAKGSFRTIKRGKGKRKITIVTCCPKGPGHWVRGRCTVGLRAQSIIKPR